MSPPKPHLRVVIKSDRREASLYIDAAATADEASPDACCESLRRTGVEVTAAVRREVERLLDSPAEEGCDRMRVVARATLPQPARAATVRWTVDEPATDEPDADEAVDFYQHSTFTMVTRDQVVGILEGAAEPLDGRDVTGQTLAAPTHTDPGCEVDDTILIDAKGQLIAQRDGVLKRTGSKASISQTLEIADNVDFHTGHIRFEGDVVIRRGVADLFKVRATGDVRIQGLVEAANIEAGGDLIAEGGIAARQHGRVVTGRNLIAHYLDNVSALVGADAIIEREVLNSQLHVEGRLQMQQAALIGGTTYITGPAFIRTVGSQAGVVTELALGRLVRIEQQVRSLAAKLHDLQDQQRKLTAEVRVLESNASRLTATAKERVTEINYFLHGLQQKAGLIQPEYDRLRRLLLSRSVVELHVTHRVFSRTRLSIAGRIYDIGKDMRGPIQFRLGKDRSVVFRQGLSDPQPISNIARWANVRTAA